MTYMSSFSRIGISRMLFPSLNKIKNIPGISRKYYYIDYSSIIQVLTSSLPVSQYYPSPSLAWKESIRLDLGSHEVHIKPSYRGLASPAGIEHWHQHSSQPRRLLRLFHRSPDHRRSWIWD